MPFPFFCFAISKNLSIFLIIHAIVTKWKNCVYVKCCVCVNVNYFPWINSKICHTIFQFWIFSVQFCVQMTHVSCYIFVRSRVPCVLLSYLFSFIFVYNFFFSRHLCTIVTAYRLKHFIEFGGGYAFVFLEILRYIFLFCHWLPT